MAMRLGKHVYCQKPLTHSVYEARLMRETAAEKKVATQMGNQGTAHPGFRAGVELIRSGVVGPVREVHVWTNRPFNTGRRRPTSSPGPKDDAGARRTSTGTCSSARRPSGPYNPVYHPLDWRGWWDFGTGAWATWPATPPTCRSWR